MILGGSTNAVLHLIAIAHSVGIKLTIDDFASVSDRIPFLADIKPSGKYVMEDVYKLGGIPSRCLLHCSNSRLMNCFAVTRDSGILT
jgi:dihydroxy-acid dehydratase